MVLSNRVAILQRPLRLENTTFVRLSRRYHDDLTADHSDDTDLERPRDSTTGRYSTYPPLQTCVSALVSLEFTAPWVGALIRAAGGQNPIKWAAVEKAVAVDRDESARSIREGLRSQIVIVTDAMESVREIDMRAGPQYGLVLSLALDRTSSLGVGPGGGQVKKALHGMVLSQLVEFSGIGKLADHIAKAYSGDIDGAGRMSGGRYREQFIQTVREGLGGSIRLATQLATGASSLAAPLMDGDSSFNRFATSERARSYETMRWSTPDPSLSRAALRTVGARRLILDDGHRDSTTMVEGLRKMASIHASASDWDLDGLGDIERPEVSDGYVREQSDIYILSLQVADVAAGWARTLLAKGYCNLCNEFRCVIYNGRELSKDGAKQLDRAIAEHRGLHEKALRR